MYRDTKWKVDSVAYGQGVDVVFSFVSHPSILNFSWISIQYPRVLSRVKGGGNISIHIRPLRPSRVARGRQSKTDFRMVAEHGHARMESDRNSNSLMLKI